MRKKLFLITGISFILFAGCKQFVADIEKDLEYWSSSAHIIDIVLPSSSNDIDGYPCVASNDDAAITLKLVNPQNYTFKTPADLGAPSDIVVFEDGVQGSGGGAPLYGTDYEFNQTGSNEVRLIYKKAFLEKSERGTQNLSASITLYNKEGRRFGTHSFKLRANTSLPVPKGIALLKTKNPNDSKYYYVLCFRPDGIEKKINNNTELLHKGLFSLPGTKTTNKFKLPDPKLNFSDSMDNVLESGVYTPVGRPDISANWINGTQYGQPDGSSAENAIPIYTAYGNDIRLKIKVNIHAPIVTAGLEIKTLIYRKTESGFQLISNDNSSGGNETSVELSAKSEEVVYRLESYAFLSGFDDSESFVKYYKVIRGVNGDTAPDVPVWGILKKAVEEKTEAGGTLIVRGEIKAPNSSGGVGNHGEIEINKDITIRGGKGSQDDILNANYGTSSGQNNNKHRIFKVLNSKNLTIKDLTLKGADSGSEKGGAIYTDGTVNLIDCVIKDNKAALGDALYIAENGLFTMRGSAKIDKNNDVYLTTGTKINISGKLTAEGTAALINPQSYPSGGENIKVLAGDISTDENYKKFKVKSNGSTPWYVGSDGSLTTEAP